MNRLRTKLARLLFPELLHCRLHKPEIVGVQPSDAPTALGVVRMTFVLQRCPHCGIVSSYHLHGHWSLDQVKGLPPAKETVDRFVGSLGREAGS